MADLLSTLKQLLVIGFQIKAAFEEAGHNKERCRWIFDLLPTLDAIAKDLEVDGDAKMRGAAAGLENSRRRASRFVAKCREKGLLRRAFDAKGIADELGWVCLDLLLHLTATNASVLAGLRADIASNASMLARILEILDAHPEVHLPEEVAKLVRAYRESNGNANPQIENKSESKQTDVPSSQTKSEKDKTDDANTRPQMKTRKSKGPGDSKVVPDAALSDDGLAVSFSSVESGVTKDGSSTIIKKATSSVSKLVDEVQSVAGFAAPFQLQQIISVSEVPGKVGSYKIESKSTKNMTSVDVHPTKTWIVMGHEEGDFFIWDYQEQKVVMGLQVNKVPGKTSRLRHSISQFIKETAVPHSVRSVKFIAQKNWLVVGDGDGYVYVYDYTDTELSEVKKFKAYRKNSVDSLAVHPTKPYLLLSSYFDRNIKLWDWKDLNNDPVKLKEFYVKPASAYEDGVHSVKFDPRDTDTFACITFDNKVKVGNINSSSLTTKVLRPFKGNYFFTHSHQHLMVTLSSKSQSEIWDLKTGKVVHTLGVGGRKMRHAAFHPTLQKLVTVLDNGTACLWDTSTDRLEEMVQITDSKCHDLTFVTDANGLTRLVVTFEKMVAIMEVNFPKASTSEPTGSGNYG